MCWKYIVVALALYHDMVEQKTKVLKCTVIH